MPEIDDVKREVAIGNRLLSEFDIAVGVRASLGHVSMRLPSDPTKFAVKGRGYRLDALAHMRPEDMVVCDLDGNWLDGPPGSLQCSEVKIHACIYQARPDVQSVTHAHPDYTVLVTVLGKELVPLAQEGLEIVAQPLPLYPHTKVVHSDEEGREVARLLADGPALLMLGHGAVTVGRSVEQSVMRLAQLEHQARLNYLALAAAGPEHRAIPAELVQEVLRGNPMPPHLKSRSDAVGGRGGGGVWAYFSAVAAAGM
ncbi:MAG: class II aldolase/adducin family protein [Chloroflexi bacterium]|nr:class II aldolase/adducin family protein [Chloroflexota bacterium]